MLIGLYGAWQEAREVVERARAEAKNNGVQLSQEELRALVNGQWEMSISAETDRLGVHMIEAACYEKINRAVSTTGYRYAVEEIKEVRHLLLLVPAYLRLALLLVRSGDNDEALALIERFETRFPTNKRGLHFPTAEQRNILKLRKSHLLGNQPEKVPA
jgi:Na+/phosphate symporter